MNNYSNNNRDRRSNSGGSSRPRFSSNGSGRTQMHDAVCGDCGGNCKVPFMPSSGKPVYCSNCFEKRGNGNNDSRRSNSSDRKSFAPKPAENYSAQFELLNTKLDTIIELLSKKATKKKAPAKKETV